MCVRREHRRKIIKEHETSVKIIYTMGMWDPEWKDEREDDGQ